MTQRDLAGRLDINVKTLRKWKKDRPKVYRLLMIGLKAENALVSFKENIEALEQLIQSQEGEECAININDLEK
ncbi:transcriptional regulator [Helicobacter apodemus]|uniref:Transcriptional regulator n=1 Tax=Helicobacter apodemus TaxID=135569 RepID=A0A2U8FEW4_9HELI|nr:transcriptional regulator [Helicobacter apodemus]AWI34694.1 transcriptional regulator [Helicobacter apodemus]